MYQPGKSSYNYHLLHFLVKKMVVFDELEQDAKASQQRSFYLPKSDICGLLIYMINYQKIKGL